MQLATPGRALWQLIKWTLLVIGLLFVAGASISTFHTERFLRRSETTDAMVVALKPMRSSRNNSISYAPVFRFNVPGSHFVTVVSNTSSMPAGFKPGERVTVHYEKDHPEKAVIDSFMQLWFGDLIFGVFGAFSMGISLIFFVFERVVRRRNLPVSNDGSGITRY
jgi:hypothetical protein